jgi:hypothetical protein
MLAVAVQLPAVALELEPEASAGPASASNAQAAVLTDLMLTRKLLLASMNEARIGRKSARLPYKILKSPVRRNQGSPDARYL